MDNLGLSYLIKGYDAKLLKQLNEDLKFIKFLENYTPPTPEELHRREVENKWYERRVARVKKVMEAYHISASSLCNCDY